MRFSLLFNFVLKRSNTIIFPFFSGAFLIPFFLMLLFIGLPIFYLELYIGQYTGLGPIQAFTSIAPAFTGVGYCTLVVISLISIYYMIIVAWTLFYTIVSIIGNLGWGSCENVYNTDGKFNVSVLITACIPLSFKCFQIPLGMNFTKTIQLIF